MPYSRLVAVASLLFASLFLAPQTLRADTIIFGSPAGGNAFPFGGSYTNSFGNQYQQIYSRDRFASPVVITQIAFASSANNFGGPRVASYNLTVRLGTSATTTANPSPNFAANRTADFATVFSGPFAASLTLSNSFDLVIDLSTPFVYSPAGGDLLFDVLVNSSSNAPANFSSAFSSDTARVFAFGPPSFPSAVTAQPSQGLYTRFAFTPAQANAIPEPATLILLGTGLAGVAARVRKRR